MRVPRFLETYRTIFGPKKEAHIESAPSQELSMIPIMGCENHIVLAIAEGAAVMRGEAPAPNPHGVAAE